MGDREQGQDPLFFAFEMKTAAVHLREQGSGAKDQPALRQGHLMVEAASRRILIRTSRSILVTLH